MTKSSPDPAVREFHAGLPGYAPTPLHDLPALADELGVRRVLVKDESSRLGLPAFKVLGASWAIDRILREISVEKLVTASDGNHGRAVAHVARTLAIPAHIFVPSGVHPLAVAAIEDEGAQVTLVNGTYDDAVRAASQAGGTLVQDMAWPGYERIPQWIVDGYTTLCVEIEEQLGGEPDLVITPAGVGSLAQAVAGYFPSKTVTVEPTTAACVLASLRADRPVTTETDTTVMAGLNCGTLSSLAWAYLRNGLHAATAVTDAHSLRAAKDLAALGVPAGPCGAAALAAARGLTLPHDATVVLLSTEGAGANPWELP
ncbi:diaminopropionate ammonia-lyase [Actinoplanes lutulentus]|uniref:pyridoxal-phosphate dependent enzyme n=1 Tax=Actinoplanes lutulentus TaxID=1287878 RepID=UPI0017CA4EBE|nr:pyridoxal-phosphate dependent enzyme [Actinoplanes lutulentus]MBB2940453.1 diaminopropionate ammonia-lyase [Actinoplanes lutulentus]